jgi:hypothetical protein
MERKYKEGQGEQRFYPRPPEWRRSEGREIQKPIGSMSSVFIMWLCSLQASPNRRTLLLHYSRRRWPEWSRRIRITHSRGRGLIHHFRTVLGPPRVRLTVGNRPVYRGNRPYRPGPVTVPAGYQPLGLGNFEFEFQKLKIVEKIPKNTS